MACLQAYDWPGNVRELENAVERALVMGGGVVEEKDLPEEVRSSAAPGIPPDGGEHGRRDPGRWAVFCRVLKRYPLECEPGRRLERLSTYLPLYVEELDREGLVPRIYRIWLEWAMGLREGKKKARELLSACDWEAVSTGRSGYHSPKGTRDGQDG
jgi:transcriptional regulator of acetoin/glycerol metabolism